MAWGNAASDDFVATWTKKLTWGDASVHSLAVMPFRSLSSDELVKLLDAVRQSHTLTDLSLSGRELDAAAVDALAAAVVEHASLAKLHFGNTSLGDEAFARVAAGLQRNASVTELNLERKGLTDDAVAALADVIASPASKLASVNLSHNAVSSSGLLALLRASLATDSALAELRLAGNSIADDGLHESADALGDVLGSACSLQRLSLAGNEGLTARGLAPMLARLPTNTSLEHLTLSRTALGDDGLKALAQALVASNGSSALHSLILAECGLTARAGTILADAAAALGGVRVLSLRGNALGDEGALALANVLAHDATSLTSLDMGGNALTGDGVVALALAGSHLKRLVLFNNAMADDGMGKLADAVVGNPASVLPRLETLDLSANCASAVGLDRIGSVLGNEDILPALTTLEVGGNVDKVQDDELRVAVDAWRASRPGLDVFWKPKDAQADEAQEGDGDGDN